MARRKMKRIAMVIESQAHYPVEHYIMGQKVIDYA